MSEKEIIFKPDNEVCCSWIKLNIEEGNENKEENKVKKIVFLGSCPGNSLALSKVLQGMEVKEIIEKLGGTRCGAKSTSCPDQLTKALKDYLGKNN